MRVSVRLGALAALAGLACWDAPTATSGPTPVVSLILAEGESLQVASVTLTTPGDSSFPSEPVSVPAEQVGLRVEDDSGNAWPLSSTGAAGRFSAVISPRRGLLYHLRGTVMGHPIEADTRVPAVFELVTPAGETVTSADTVPCYPPTWMGEICVRLVVESDCPGPVACQVRDQAGPTSVYCYFSSGTGELRLLQPDRIREVVLMTRNGDADTWRGRDPLGRPPDAVWRFGAAVALSRRVSIP